MTELFVVSPQAVLALGLALVLSVAAVRMARDPEAPPPIKFAFAGLPLLLGILGVTYLAADLGLLR